MSKNGLQKHKTADRIKWIVTLLVGLALIGAVIGLAIKLERQTSTTTIGGEAYSIGMLDSKGAIAESNQSIILRNAITTDGLSVKLGKDATVKYQLFFYDKNGSFISASEQLTSDFNGSVPDNAETVKIMITPTADEDGKVSLIEVLGYANQLTVTVNK